VRLGGTIAFGVSATMVRMSDKSPMILVEPNQTLDTMMHQILNQALVAIGAKAGSLMLVANKRGILQIKARLGEPRSGRTRERLLHINNESIAGWVVNNKRSYLCNDVDADATFTPSRSGRNFASVLSVPIIYDNLVVAVINADAVEKYAFGADQQSRLELVANQVAQPLAERISVVDALAEVGVELTRLPREGGVERVLEKISELARASLGADVVTLYQYVQDRDEFPVEGTGPAIGGVVSDRRPMRRKIYRGDVPWTVVQQRRSGFYGDVRKHDFLSDNLMRRDGNQRPRFVERESIQSMAAVLLPYRASEDENEEVVGVMFANYRKPHEFNIDEISALSTFADYAAVAILNARHEEQRQADQVRVVESVSANLAHRMGNLAGPSRVASQLLRERISPDDRLAQRQLDKLEREADMLMGLADRLVRRFKETGSVVGLSSVPIGELVEQAFRRLGIDERSQVQCELPPNLPQVKTVEFQLAQVLHDMLNNALEAVAVRPGGLVRLVANANLEKKRVQVEISDNGVGIPDEIHDSLFAPGVSAKSDTLGIGLWYSRTFMQATGGDVILKRTALGEGTTFLLEIPFADDEDELVAGQPLAPTEQVDVLIVDDTPVWRDDLRDALPSEHCSFRMADSYAEAMRQLASTRFKLAILDLRLVHADEQNKDGLRLLQHIDEQGLGTKVIVITGYGDLFDRQPAGRSANLVGVLSKGDFDLQQYRELVRRGLRAAQPVPDDG
jgi:signal transduction histidine kinase